MIVLPRVGTLLGALLAYCAGGNLAAQPPADAGLAQQGTVSIGAPNEGYLVNGIPLPKQGEGFVHNDKRPNQDARFGTEETIAALIEAGRLYAHSQQCPTPLNCVHAAKKRQSVQPMVINDISLPQGGTIPHHGSHQSGRDVDILFPYLDKKGKPFAPAGIPVDHKGHGWEFGNLSDPKDDVFVRLDVPRLWWLMIALISQEAAQLQRIFIAEHIRTMLIDHAQRTRAPSEVLQRFEAMTCQPEHPHDDHVHIRFFCPPSDIPLGCLDTWPIYPWHERFLKSHGRVARLAEPKLRKSRGGRGSLVSQAILKTAHARVIKFLRARELWYVKPHPGREFCK